MKKFKLFIDMKKEEQYLKEMAEKGWGLVKYSAYNRYTFEKIHPESLSYRIDYQMFKKKGDYTDYLTLFEDSGWKHISGSQSSGFHFFLPENDNNQDLDIFSVWIIATNIIFSKKTSVAIIQTENIKVLKNPMKNNGTIFSMESKTIFNLHIVNPATNVGSKPKKNPPTIEANSILKISVNSCLKILPSITSITIIYKQTIRPPIAPPNNP